MNTYELTVLIDGETETLAAIAYLLSEDAHVVGLVQLGDLTDDEIAEDITELLPNDDARLDTLEGELNEMLDNPDVSSEQLGGMIADVRGVQSEMTHSNARMIVLDGIITRLENAMVEARLRERDDAPPNGITRPRIIHGPDWPTDYWVDTSSNPTQGSGRHHPGLEMVPCLECHAPIGEVCITGSHGRYRRGFGHASRRRDARAAQGLSS